MLLKTMQTEIYRYIGYIITDINVYSLLIRQLCLGSENFSSFFMRERERTFVYCMPIYSIFLKFFEQFITCKCHSFE